MLVAQTIHNNFGRNTNFYRVLFLPIFFMILPLFPRKRQCCICVRVETAFKEPYPPRLTFNLSFFAGENHLMPQNINKAQLTDTMSVFLLVSIS